MKELQAFKGWKSACGWTEQAPWASAELLFNAEDIMLDAMRLLSTAKAGQDANELAARMNEWCEAWNE